MYRSSRDGASVSSFVDLKKNKANSVKVKANTEWQMKTLYTEQSEWIKNTHNIIPLVIIVSI